MAPKWLKWKGKENQCILTTLLKWGHSDSITALTLVQRNKPSLLCFRKCSKAGNNRWGLPNHRVPGMWPEADLREMEVMRTCWCSEVCPRIRSGCISRVSAVLPSEGDYQEKFQRGLWTLFLGVWYMAFFICYTNSYLFVERDELLSLYWIYSLTESSAQCSSYTIMSKFTFPNREWVDKSNVSWSSKLFLCFI